MTVGKSFGLKHLMTSGSLLMSKVPLRNILVWPHQVLGEGFPYLEEANIQKFFHVNAAVLTEEDVVEVDENSDVNVDIPHLTTAALKRGSRWWVA